MGYQCVRILNTVGLTLGKEGQQIKVLGQCY